MVLLAALVKALTSQLIIVTSIDAYFDSEALQGLALT